MTSNNGNKNPNLWKRVDAEIFVGEIPINGKVQEALMQLDGVAAANVDEPSAGDLERVMAYNRQLRDRIKTLEAQVKELENEIKELAGADT